MALSKDALKRAIDSVPEGHDVGVWVVRVCRAVEAEVHKQDTELIRQLVDAQEDAARYFFDAGWKACANFCDRDDVRFDGIVGHRGCPQFDEAFRAARKQGGV